MRAKHRCLLSPARGAWQRRPPWALQWMCWQALQAWEQERALLQGQPALVLQAGPLQRLQQGKQSWAAAWLLQ